MTTHQIHKTHLCSYCGKPGHNRRTCKIEWGHPGDLKSNTIYGGKVDQVIVVKDTSDLVSGDAEVQECIGEVKKMMLAGF